jgi:hypothetical protein
LTNAIQVSWYEVHIGIGATLFHYFIEPFLARRAIEDGGREVLSQYSGNDFKAA